jgi:hypothetical protein
LTSSPPKKVEVAEAEPALKLAAVAVPAIVVEAILVDPRVTVPAVRLVAKRFVELAVVAKKFVVVAEVPVAFRKVKFWSVVEPVSKRFASVASPAVAVRVPVKLAALDIVWPLMSPAVIAPVVKLVEKRLVELAVVAKLVVEVALVVVELSPVKFWRVVELTVRRVESEVRPEVTESAAPAPDWVRVMNAVAVEVELVASVRRNCVEFKPLSFCASKAAGTAPRIFLGDISPSQVGLPADPPISTPR